MRNVLITGCNGYLGVEMSMYFRMHGWKVFGVDLNPAPACQEGVLADFEEKPVQELKAGPWVVDAVVHLAGASKLVDDYPAAHYTEHNVHSTKRLRELYADTPLYLASTTAMYNEQKQVDHKHPYSRSKYEAEEYADVVFRMGSINGTNRNGMFHNVIDLMIDSAITKNEIVVAQGSKMRPLAGLTYICMMYYRAVANGVFAARAKQQGARVIQHLYETCQSIENIGMAVHRCLNALPDSPAEDINFIRQNDLKGILKQAPVISGMPPDFQPSPVYDIRLFRLVMECVERYEYFAKTAGSGLRAGEHTTGTEADTAA